MEQTKKKTDVETEGLSGPVKQLMQITYKAHLREKVITQSKIESDYSFHRKNLILTFNEKGAKTQEQLFGTDGTYIYTHEGKDLPTETLHYKDGKLFQKTIHRFNDRGNHIETIVRNADGSLQYRVVNKFNELGHQLEHIHYMGNEERVLTKTVYDYEDTVRTTNGIQHKNMLSLREYDGEGTLKRNHYNKYDERGNRLESVTEYTEKDKQQFNTRNTQKYNEHNDCIELTFYNPDGSVKNSYTYTYQYDSEGKKIVPERDPLPEPNQENNENEKFEKDSHGNWIKKTTFSNKIPVNIFIREISYYDDDSARADSFVHPVQTALPEEVVESTYKHDPLTPEEAQWLTEAANAAAENFPLLRYYALRFRDTPSIVTYTGPNIEAFALLHLLKKNMNAQVIHSYSTVWHGGGEKIIRYTLSFPHRKYLLHATHIQGHDEEEFTVPEFMEESPITQHDGNVHLSQFQLLRPSDASGDRDEYFEDYLDNFIEESSLRKKPDKPTIHMIEVKGNSFSMVEHPVDDNFEIRDMDVHYGYGFEKFHNELMQRFRTETKGLILFHGLPGTGKTFYIRHLLRKMVSDNRKVVIYMPPNMVDHLVEPAFMTFLMGEVQRWSNDGYFSVLLIEDAEPLLAKRVEGVRIQGVTNLLNMSDGLLNDMLNLQIICTFNVDVKKLDSALLRPGRLIARKEFKPLGVLDANLLASRLGIKHHFEEPATLSEIYALRKNKNTLIHDVEPDRDASSIIDDLI